MWSKWRPQSLFGKLMAAHLVVILVTLLAIGFFFSYLVEKYFFSAREWELTTQAEKIAEMLTVELQSGNYEEVRKTSQTLALSMDVKIRVIDVQKYEIAIAMPQEEQPSVDLEPNEIDYVLQGDTLAKKVYGPALQRLLIAMPIFREEAGEDDEAREVIGAITVSAPLTSFKAIAAQISRLALYSLFFATIVASILAFSLAKTISHPLQAMTRAAREMVRGTIATV
jgi:sensor histidine kinase regulating citrate/malate metabolism